MDTHRKSITLRTYLLLTTSVMFLVSTGILMFLMSQAMRRQALNEAEFKDHLLLERNLAIHTYFSHDLKPKLFELIDSLPTLSEDYFEPTWMSSTYAIRKIDKYFQELSPAEYYYKESAINARSPENEADAYERAFIEELNANPDLKRRSEIREFTGKPYFVTLRRGEVMAESCLQCHSTPGQAPDDLVRQYGADRSFGREPGNVVSAISTRVPLDAAYRETDRVFWQFAGIFISVVLCLSGTQFWLIERFLVTPLGRVRDKALQIVSDTERLKNDIPLPAGYELRELTTAFNTMSGKLWQYHDHLEELVNARTAELVEVNMRLQKEVTERGLAEKSITQAQRELQLTLDATTDGIWTRNFRTNVLFFSPRYYRMLGYEPNEFPASFETWQHLIHPDDLEHALRVAECWLRTKQGRYENEFRLRTKQGTYRWLRATGTVVERDNQGDAIRMIGNHEDITARKQAEEALRQSEANLQALIENTDDIMVSRDRKGHAIVFNSSFAQIVKKLFGIEAQPGIRTMDYLPEAQKAHWEHMLENVLAGEHYREEFFWDFDDERRYYDLSLTPIRVEGEIIGSVEFNHDITERKQAKEQLKAALEAKDALLQEVHHRTRNNMQMMSALLDLQTRSVEDAGTQKLLKTFRNHIDAIALVHEQLRQADLMTIDLREYLQDLTRMLQYRYQVAPERVALSFDLEPIRMVIDPAVSFGLLVYEVVSNAWQHAFPGNSTGELHISLHSTAEGQRELRVLDTGVGLPKDFDAERASTPGFQFIRILTQTLQGTVDFNRRAPGTEVIITFKEPQYRQRI